MPEEETPSEPTPPAEQEEEPKTLTQAEIDAIVENRLQRERSKYSDYDDLKAKASKLDEIEDEKKTEVQRASDKATEAEKRAEKAERDALRLDVALEKAPEGMSMAQVRKLARRLTGDDREALEADADELFAEFTPPAEEEEETPGVPRRPKPRLKPGATPSGGEPEETDPRKLAARIPRRGY